MLDDCLTDLENIKAETSTKVSPDVYTLILGYIVTLDARGYPLPTTLKRLSRERPKNPIYADYLKAFRRHFRVIQKAAI